MSKELPLSQGMVALVDDDDRNPLNNQRSNLRIVTHQENQLNKGRYRNNSSGLPGLTWNTYRGKWQVTVQKNGVRLINKLFSSREEAEQALAATRPQTPRV